MPFKTNPGKDLDFLFRTSLKILGNCFVKVVFLISKYFPSHLSPWSLLCLQTQAQQEWWVFSGLKVNSWSSHSSFLDFFSSLFLKRRNPSFLLCICLTNSSSKCLVVICIIQFLNLVWNCYLKRLESADVNMGKQELLLLERTNTMFWKRLAGCASKGWLPRLGHCWTGQKTAELPDNLLLYCSLVIKSLSFFFIRNW